MLRVRDGRGAQNSTGSNHVVENGHHFFIRARDILNRLYELSDRE